MNILQVAPRYPPHTGGVETHVAALSERFAQRGHDVIVLTAGATEDVPDYEVREGVRICRHRAFSPGGAYHLAPGLITAVRDATADIVHAHNYHSFPLLFAALARTTPLVVTPHYHGASAETARNLLLSAYRPIGGWALNQADECIAVSGWERRRLREHFGLDATVIPNGLDTKRFADAVPEHRDGRYLLCVGRLEAYKGVQYAVEAIQGLPTYELVIAGDGTFRADLRSRVDDLGVSDRVTFLGYVDEDRLPGLYAGAAAHLALSSFEAYGLTVAEALAAGTPCVVYEAMALTEWTDCTGVVGIETRTPNALAQAVEDVVGLQPRAVVPDWTEVADDVEACYNRVLSDGSGG